MAKVLMRTDHMSVVPRGGEYWILLSDKSEYGPYGSTVEASEDMLGLQEHYDNNPLYVPSLSAVSEVLFLDDSVLNNHPDFEGVLDCLFINVEV